MRMGISHRFSDEEVQERTQMAKELSQKAKETGDLKSVAEEAGLRPIESSMGRSNEGDGQEPLDAGCSQGTGSWGSV